ncbi:MAG: Hsp20/alpha crystallin family protein [Desulfobacteraceae bacterium]|nr:Hsp20/alpha crystallin family protein [Desulfobacteraceae bacterium]
MTNTESKALEAREKAEVTTPAEDTRPGLTFTPPVDIFETDEGLTLLADLPGVKAEDLMIDLREGVMSLSGDVQPPEGPDEVDVLREYQTGKYHRKFNLSDVIDQSKIEAELKDGVLRLNLPKIETAAPRKIAVKAG